jgi:type I restriction-modification system DNA methylase subunit
MPKQYTCELCKKIFNQKCDYNKHINKKTPCITLNEMQEINKIIEENMDTKRILTNIFDKCLNTLRDNEGLTGDKALRNMSYLLILKLIEPHMGNKINIDEYDYDFSHIEDEFVSRHKIKLLEIVRFSKLSQEKEDNIPSNIKYLWDDILSVHPSTKNIFLKDKGFDIKHKSTYIKIINDLNKLPESEQDILGDAYEEIIKSIMTGKVLGQFFTQPLVKKIMVKLINPQIYPDGKIDSCCDPTMGTGGFLIEYMKEILKQARIKNIEPDWDFIKNEGIYGKEIEPDTYQLAVSNMLISSGYMFEKLDRGDSIREPILRKFDNILANPPFGIKGLKYDDFQSSHKNEYVPIKTDNAVSLFIQAIIYMLKINGKCAVVLPDGQDLFSKNNATLIAVREFLVKTCDLKEIIYLPSGIFENTTIKTCIFFFIKKKEGTEVIETKIRISKTQKELGRDYKFSKTHQTTSVKFYDCNPYKDVKNLLVEVPIEKLAANSYSFNYAEYMKDETEEEKYEEGVIVKTLGEVCKFLPKSKRNAKYGNKEGLYPFFKSSIKVDSYIDEPDYEEESLIIGDGGEPNVNYGIKFSASDHCYILQNKNELVLNIKYAYYYLYHNLDMMRQLYTGVAIKNISKTNIEGIKIPIPSLERQQEIVKYLDFIYEKSNKTSTEKIVELKKLNKYCLNNQKIFGENVVKTLGVITTYKSGKRLPQGHILQNDKTSYPYIRITDIDKNTISLDNIKYITQETKNIINKYIITTDDIFITIAGTTGLVGIIPDELDCANLTENAIRINIINKNEILQKYLVYDIHYNQQKELKTKTIGAAIPKLSIERLMTLKIPIPSLERQKEIVEYCDFNDKLIKQLEKEIENNKKQARECINSIVKICSAEIDDSISEASDNSE